MAYFDDELNRLVSLCCFQRNIQVTDTSFISFDFFISVIKLTIPFEWHVHNLFEDIPWILPAHLMKK